MNWNDEQCDPLDDLLQKAAWPEPRAEQFERLEGQWRRTVRRRKIRLAATVGVLGMVPLAVVALVLSMTFGRQRPDLANTPKIDEPMVVKQPDPLTPTLSPKEREPETLLAREPTVYELTMVAVYRNRAGVDQIAAAPLESPTPPVDPIPAAIARLVENPKSDVAHLAKELAAALPNCEARLRELIQHSVVVGDDGDAITKAQSERRGALRLLSHVVTLDSLSVLLTAEHESDCPIEVLQGIARLSSVEQLVQRARNDSTPQRQRLWMTALLGRGSMPAVAAFLELAADATTSAATLKAARDVDKPPVDELFAALSSNRVATRRVAARVLGALNDPAVSQRLAQMAQSGAGWREALVALLSSNDPVARKFLADAEQNVELAPSIRALAPRF